MSARRGFTLIEMLLTMAMMTGLFLLSAPVYQAFQSKNDLDVGAYAAASGLRRAQMLARGSEGDGDWGLAAAAGEVVVFKGSTYAARDAGLDETFSFADSVVPTGTTEFVFGKMTGDTADAGTMTLTNAHGLTREITVNAKGMVTY